MSPPRALLEVPIHLISVASVPMSLRREAVVASTLPIWFTLNRKLPKDLIPPLPMARIPLFPINFNPSVGELPTISLTRNGTHILMN